MRKKMKNSPIIQTLNGKIYFSTWFVLGLINPRISHLVHFIYLSNVDCNLYGYEDEQYLFFEKEDALRFLERERCYSKKPEEHELLLQIYNLLKPIVDTIPPINIKNNPEYVNALLNYRPELKKLKRIRKVFLLEDLC